MKKILLLVLIAFLTACSSAPKVNVIGEWRLVSYGSPSNPTPALPNVETSITFSDGKVSGNVGCNGFGGSYQLRGDTITFSDGMSTMMYCEETSAQEQGALALLFSPAELKISLNGNLLTIASADGTSQLTLAQK